MGAEKVDRAWICPECGLPWWEVEDAMECCQTGPERVTAWACDDCRVLYTTKEMAESCPCGEE